MPEKMISKDQGLSDSIGPSTPEKIVKVGKVDYGSDENRKRIRAARFALIFVGLLSVGVNIYFTIKLLDEMKAYGVDFSMLPISVTLIFIIAYVVSFSYIVLFFWAKTNPYAASLTGLIIYGLNLVASAVIEPENIFKGVLWKVLIIFALARALKAGLDFRNYQRSVNIEKTFG